MKNIEERIIMTNPLESTTLTKLELKFILERNFCHDGFYAALWCCCASLLFGSYCFRMCCIAVAFILLLTALVNKILKRVIENWDGVKIRDWRRMKAVVYFLMLHYHTRDHTRLVLQHMERKQDVMMCESISLRGVNELELMEILNYNVWHSVCYICLFSQPLMSRYILGLYCVYYWCLRILVIFIPCVIANLLIGAAVAAGHGERNGEWCSRKVVACFLMLHYHTRDRARAVLQRMENERRKDLKIGEIISFKKGKKAKNVGDGCNICWRGYRESERVRIVRKCNHCFHAYCFKQWLHRRREGTCPMCRTNIV